VVIGAASRLSPEKGLDDLIEAFAIVHERFGDRVSLRIAGEGPERPKLEAQIARLGISGSVQLLGWLEHAQLPAFFQDIDVFALPSTWEGFGVSAVEASAMQLPVVGTDVHGIPDAVRDGATGLLVPAADPPALAGALTRLIDDQALRTRLGVAGRAYVATQYDWRENARQMERIYHAMTTQR
jgi:glycosyltransferase involved in cell wall biosynthesis